MMPRLLTLSEKIRKALDLPQVINIIDQLPHHASRTWPKRSMDLLQGITIHHFASEAPIVNQALYHIREHNWVGLAYTIVIRDGQILQTNYLDDRTSHASGGNDISWGVCIGGDLSKRSMTDFERRALSGVSIALKELKEGLWVKGHNQIGKTSCPCTDMNRIREDISSAEEKLDYLSQPSASVVRAYAIADRITSLWNRQNDKYGGECKRKILKFGAVEGLEGLEAIKVRVCDDLAKKMGKLNEATRKLNLYADFAEKNNLM